MTDYPEGAQILSSPPPAHPLYGKYPGRLLILADGTEVLMDKGLIPDDLMPRDREVILDLSPSGELVIHEEPHAN